MDNVITVDFDVYTPEQVQKELTALFERAAASRGYDPSNAGETAALVMDAMGRMRDYHVEAVISDDPRKDLQDFGQKVAWHCCQVLVEAAIPLRYPGA